jgi:hypothetical protein
MLGFSVWHIAVPVPELPMFADSFVCKLPQLNNINFFGDQSSVNLAYHGKLCTNCHNGKQTLIFTFFLLLEYDAWWVQIHIGDPDPCQVGSRSFKQIQILKELWQFALWTFSLAVRVVAKSAGSENPDLISMDIANFQIEKCVREPLFRPILTIFCDT